MRSIRLSLIIYFLALLGLGLGAVCGLFYFTTARTLQQKEESTSKLYEKEFQNACAKATDDLDRHLVQQARLLAARTMSMHIAYESFLSPGAYTATSAFGALSALSSPAGHLNVPLWAAAGTHPSVSGWAYRTRFHDVYIASRHDDTREEVFGDDEPKYFQLFRGDEPEELVKASPSMGDAVFAVDDEIRKGEVFSERLDTVTVDGKQVRRVTFKGAVAKFRFSRSPGFGGRPGPPGFSKPFWPPRGPTPKKMIERSFPTFYLMSGTDLEPLEKELLSFSATRDQNLATLREETAASLAKLCARLSWIGLAVFAGLALGSLGLLSLGLRPLHRLSEAVSRVSEKNFHLPIESDSLPAELRPIASRLRETLDQLQKAFDREKQAAADISHELRTPLAALLTNMDVALRKERSAEHYREVLQECRESGQQMYQLVERLLTLARLDAGAVRLKVESIDVTKIAGQCVQMVKPLVQERGIRLSMQDDGPVMLKADPDKIREVLNNLLHNAIEYNKPEGAIDLKVQRNNGHVELAVSDTGVGISQEAKEHIFERFFRADPSRHAETPHAGLGLSIVKSYVDLMGGTIAVESGTGGSTFTVCFPAEK